MPFIAKLALKEKQIQQTIRPIIAVHKWFARRPGTLFRGLLLSEFGGADLQDTFFSSNDLSGLRIADPFMGGGTPIIEANRLGMEVHGWDVNPMSFWIVSEAIREIDIDAYSRCSKEVEEALRARVGSLYETACPRCREKATAKYFIWVKRALCGDCGTEQTLYPGSIVARSGRHPRNVFVCLRCAEIYEAVEEEAACPKCLLPSGTTPRVTRGGWVCSACSSRHPLPGALLHPLTHELVAIEVYCPECSRSSGGRLFKKPDSKDHALADLATRELSHMKTKWIPDETIPRGDETDRLHRWGYRKYRDLFNARQLLVLETLASLISKVEDARIANALATNLSDLVRYQNLLCRYDTKALKSLDVFSVHGFPVGLVQCESNALGIRRAGTASLIGSGGWLNITRKYRAAKEYCTQPFEVAYRGKLKREIPTPGEQIGTRSVDGSDRIVSLSCATSTRAEIEPGSLNAVVTDPPYFANVQYAELMDFCYVWLRRLVRGVGSAFKSSTTRTPEELTGNLTLGRDIVHFTAGLSVAFRRFADGLKLGGPFVFTYHHNKREAYDPVTVALLDARLVVTRAFPCPAEMGGSIHIQGTKSSILDSVFVCRRTGALRSGDLVATGEGLRTMVRRDLLALRSGGIRSTTGDARCLAFGHITRLATWVLRDEWKERVPPNEKLSRVRSFAASFGDIGEIVSPLSEELKLPSRQQWEVCEPTTDGDSGGEDEVLF